jgi:PAS domain S-box-containing protein
VPASQLAAALEAQSAGVFVAEARPGPRGLKMIFANAALAALTGRTQSDLVGQPHGLLHAGRAEMARVRRWLPRAVPGQSLGGDGLLVRGDGTRISATWSLDPIFSRKGRLTHVVATYRDQTERRRVQDALMHTQRLEAVGRLAGGVAHDFNNLLSVINGYCEILAAHVAANPQALRQVAEIHHAGRKAATLTQQLLAFSRRQPLNARVINLNVLVEENAAILRRLIGDAGTLELELAPALSNVRTDPDRFQQVLLNLVLNARDALRPQGRIVVHTAEHLLTPGHLRRHGDLPAGRYVALSVADNGTGMNAETQKHLFEPFFTTKPEGKGTGLGLALVYGVVNQSGGSIVVQSAPGVGSTFEVLLPAVDEPVSAPPPAIAPLRSLRGTENVLLVEHDEVVRKMVAGILTTDGYRVHAVSSFAGLGREKRPARPWQLLIAPIAGEGDRFARKLLGAQPALRILRTGQNDQKAPVSWIAANRQAVIKKPFALSELLFAARKLLDA